MATQLSADTNGAHAWIAALTEGEKWPLWAGLAGALAAVAAPSLWAAGKDAVQSAALQHVATAKKPHALALMALKALGPPIEPYDAYEGKLATLPVPRLDQTAARYLESIKALCSTDEEFAQAKQEVEAFFSSSEAQDLQAVLHARAAKSKNWLADWWLSFAYLHGRDPLPINVSFFVFNCYRRQAPNRSPALRAAGQVYCALEYRQRLLTKDAPMLKAGGVVPVDMSGYKYLYGTSRVPGEQLDALVTNTAPGLDGNAHIVVSVGSSYWKVPVQTAGWKISIEELYLAFRTAMQTTSSQEGGAYADPPIALLTTDSRDRWARARSALLTSELNAESMKEIDDALMWVNLHLGGEGEEVVIDEPARKPTALDSLQDGADVTSETLRTEKPVTNVTAKTFWYDGGDGRRHWWDKCIAISMLPSGQSAMVVEHTFADAPVPGTFWEYTACQEDRIAGPVYIDIQKKIAAGTLSALPEAHPAVPTKLAWEVPGWSAAVAASLSPRPLRLVRSSTLGWAALSNGVQKGGDAAWNSSEWDAVPTIGDDVAAAGAEATAAADADEAELPAELGSVVAWLQGARRRFDALVGRVHMRTLYHEKWGKNAIKKWKMPPDAFMQQVLQLASLTYFGHSVLTYESASTRAFEEGRTETIRSATADARAMAEAVLTAAQNGDLASAVGLASDGEKVSAAEFADAVAVLQGAAWKAPAGAEPTTVPALAAAVRKSGATHRALTGAAMRGEGVDRHVLGLKLAALTTGKPLPKFFTSPVTHAADGYQLSTSQSPLAQEIAMKGSRTYRPDLNWEADLSLGGGFGPTADPGIGCSYHILPTMIYVIMSARGQQPVQDCVRFEACVQAALLVLGGILESANKAAAAASGTGAAVSK